MKISQTCRKKISVIPNKQTRAIYNKTSESMTHPPQVTEKPHPFTRFDGKDNKLIIGAKFWDFGLEHKFKWTYFLVVTGSIGGEFNNFCMNVIIIP